MKWTFKQLEPQPARGRLFPEIWDSEDWIAEEKYDGDRRIAQFCSEVVRFTGRRKSVTDGLYVEKTANVPHLSGFGQFNFTKNAPKELDGTVLDGEMICSPAKLRPKEGQSKFVTSIMGSLPEEAVRKQEDRGWLWYVVFDCLFYKGKDLRGQGWAQRREAAQHAVSEWRNLYVMCSDYVSGAKKEKFLAKIYARGGEGVVLKSVAHRYGEKTGWVKVKQEFTADVVIMDFKSAKEESKKVSGKTSATKFAKEGLIGAVICGQYKDGQLIEVASVSGMDDDLRRDMTFKYKSYLGRVMELEVNGREPTGRFRHPRFKRFRTDKDPTECEWETSE